MAEQTTERMVVEASPAQCFEAVADIERYPEWVADLKEVHVLERDDQGRPVVVAFRAAAFGRSTNYTLVYDYSKAPEQFGWVQRSGDLTDRLDGFYRFVEAPGGGTEITYQLVAELRVPLPGFIKRRAEGNILHAAIRDLKARVENES
ncbi:MAG TPA: SRPBCC family protein [Acidimicrobiales bacterium]|nr:SRPBCC family protein [Acidimicrobiales bacterium]